MSRRPKPSEDPASDEIILHQGLSLVETDDPVLMVELMADARLRSRLVAQLSPCVALIQPGAAGAFVQDLRKSGHTPKVSDR